VYSVVFFPRVLLSDHLFHIIYCIQFPFFFQYNSLYADFKHFEETIGRTENVLQLLTELQQVLLPDATLDNSTVNLLNRGHTWNLSINQFITKLDAYTAYQDLTTSPIAALKALQIGIYMLLNKLREKIQQQQFFGHGRTSHHFVHPAQLCVELFEVVHQLPLEAHRLLTDAKIFNTSKYLSRQHSTSLSNLPHDMLVISLQFLQNHFKSNLNVRADGSRVKQQREAITYFKSVLSAFYQLWCNRKQFELEEEARKSSLYKFKSQTHCENKSEEESATDKQNELFPTYGGDYEDIIPRDILNDQKEIAPKENESELKDESKACVVDETLVYHSMKAIFLHVESSGSGKISKSKILMESYQLVWKLLKIPEVVYGE